MNDSMLKRPSVTPFIECPNCKRLLECGAKTCPACREEFSAEYAYVSALVVAHNTQACSSANTIKTAEPAAVIILLASLLGYLSGIRSTFFTGVITPAICLLVISVWFYRFGRFNLGDEDYAKAKRDMWWSLRLWSALFVVELIMIIYALKL